MARLKAATRNALPASKFAEPAKRAYPIPDKAHARDALARVAADGSPHEKAVVRAAVRRMYPDIGRGQ
jgi:hypothetical protein